MTVPLGCPPLAAWTGAFGDTHRGREGPLFKRDFGALWLDLFPGLALVAYGFFLKRATGLDNLTWWLFAKP